MTAVKSEPLPGYHFSSTEDGAFAIEVDEPCEGVVTVTWKPKDYPGKDAVIEMPQNLFLHAVKSYIAEATATKPA